MIKVFVAASVLTIPGGFKLAGLVGGPLVLIFTVKCTTYSILLLIESRDAYWTRSGGTVLSYGDLCGLTPLGKNGALLVECFTGSSEFFVVL